MIWILDKVFCAKCLNIYMHMLKITFECNTVSGTKDVRRELEKRTKKVIIASKKMKKNRGANIRPKLNKIR